MGREEKTHTHTNGINKRSDVFFIGKLITSTLIKHNVGTVFKSNRTIVHTILKLIFILSTLGV